MCTFPFEFICLTSTTIWHIKPELLLTTYVLKFIYTVQYTQIPPPSEGFPWLCLAFDCRSLHLLLSGDEWPFSDSIGHRCMSKAEHHQESFHWFIFLDSLFGSILGLWGVQPLVLVLQAVRHESILKWASSWTSHGLVTPMSTVLPLPQHILSAGQIVSQRFCCWVEALVPLFKTFRGFKRWPIWTLYPLSPHCWETYLQSLSYSKGAVVSHSNNHCSAPFHLT